MPTAYAFYPDQTEIYMTEHYRSWVINHNATGVWTATRHGVSMCNNSKESIKRMVDRKLWEQQTERDQRNKDGL